MKTTARILSVLLAACFIHTGCSNSGNTSKPPEMSAAVSDYGQTAEGPAKLYTLKNKTGMQVEITNYGGIITRLSVPDKNGQSADVVLGFDKLQDYQNDHPYFGAIIGRYGNRIAKGKFTLDGQEYALATNNGPNTLHGGPTGFHKHLWQTTEIHREGYTGLELSRLSQDMEEGYPGNLQVTVRYLLGIDSNELLIEYEATTDKPTIVNLTNHAYFNLKGAGQGDILSHELMIAADRFTPVDSTLIPTGVLQVVEATPFDFRTPTAIGARINADDEQLGFGGGYDHNFVLNRKGTGMELIASVYEPASGRFMEVLTTEPGIQFYSGNFLDGSNIGKGGVPYRHRSGFCLETQHYPDSPNQPSFPSTVLRPDERYTTSTVYRFSVK
ncbi:MAG: galactose mutarotase [Lewinellaceae bacterium]|nr:galactose mutarotase [Lewinellaceae bacterium]